jgi:hypothetical protein
MSTFEGTAAEDLPTFRTLGESEASATRTRLLAQQSCSDFCAAVDALDQMTSSGDLFCSTKLGFLSEALTLAKLSTHISIEQICLANNDPSQNWPDGHVWIDGKKIDVEVTSVFKPGRKVGEEYRRLENIECESIDDWTDNAAAIPPALHAAILKKSAKALCGQRARPLGLSEHQ